MTLIDNNTDTAYSNVCKAEAARRMKVNVRTVYTWVVEKQYKKVIYGNYTLYVNEVKLKQTNGNRNAKINENIKHKKDKRL